VQCCTAVILSMYASPHTCLVSDFNVSCGTVHTSAIGRQRFSSFAYSIKRNGGKSVSHFVVPVNQVFLVLTGTLPLVRNTTKICHMP